MTDTLKSLPQISHLFKTILLLIAYISLCYNDSSAQQQNIVTILNSDRAVSVQEAEGTIRRLTGNVHLRTRDIEVRSDSAWHYVDKGEIHGFGNLRIVTRNDTIYADLLKHHIRDEISVLNGNVVVISPDAKIYSSSAIYSFITEIALFNDPLWMQDNTGIMQAKSGIYFSQNDSAVFRGKVQLADSLQYIEADSVFASRSSKRYDLFGNVFIDDLENHTKITGNYVYADSTGRRIIDGNALLKRIRAESDTTWLMAGHIEVNMIDSLHIIDAVGRVRSIQKESAAISDSLHYDEQSGIFRLRSNPLVWYEQIQLSGNRIDIVTQNDTLVSIHAVSNAFSAQLDTLTQRFNQMKGDSLVVHFLDGQVHKTEAIAQSELLLHYVDDNDEPDGAVTIRSNVILVFFEDGEVANLKALSGIEGETLEETPEIGELRLENFRWNPEVRPMIPDVRLQPRFEPISENPPFKRRY